MRDNGDFLKDLRREIDATQERRDEFIKQKFFYVVGLFGIGSVSVTDINLHTLLYIAPIVAFAFDMYIIGEEFRVRRAGAFISSPTTNAPDNEKEWEEFVDRHRDPFSKKAGVLLSLIVLFAAAVAILSTMQGTPDLFLCLWFIFNIIIIVGLWAYKNHLAGLDESFKSS